MDNISKMTKENVQAFVTGLQNGDLQRKISEDTGISEATLSIWKRRALARMNRFLEMTFSFNRSVIFSEGKMKNLDIARCGRRWLKRLQQIE